MIQTTPFDSQISELNRQIAALASQARELEQQRAFFLCPFKVGDILKNDTFNKLAKIIQILPGYSGYKIIAHLSKADGQWSTVKRELYQQGWEKWENPELIKAVERA